MRLLLNAKRTEQGYRGAEVLVGPSRTEEAYVAAVLALQGEEMERERDKRNRQSDKMARASKAILFFELRRVHRTYEATRDAVYQAMKELGLSKEERFKGTDFIDGLRLTLLYELLRYFRPDLDYASEKERIELLERTIGYANDYLKALRRLTAFLQYGKPGACEGLPTRQVTPGGVAPSRLGQSLYAALDRGRIDYEALRKLLARHPLAGAVGEAPVYAVDASVWDRCDAETSPQRGYYYHPWRHSAGQPIVAGWAYQFVAQLNFVRESWTAPVDVERSGPPKRPTWSPQSR